MDTTVLFLGTILEGGSMRTADYGVVPLMGSDVDKHVKVVVTNAYVVRKKTSNALTHLKACLKTSIFITLILLFVSKCA